VRGNEQGKTYFVEIFTWRDANIPDAPPAAIQNIWAEMNQLVESLAEGRASISRQSPQSRRSQRCHTLRP
jgi:hypothetical protein